ncbi:hypothetical protein OXX59_010523, partial [Metschnikowia pulcherrima]
AFRVNYLIQDLEKKLDCAGAIAGVASSYTHYVSLKQNLSAAQRKLLEILLTYDSPVDTTIEANKTLQKLSEISGENGDVSSFAALADSNSLLVRILPRAGTISPWSSKATDIA